MRIQHNIAAMNAYRNYNTNTSAVSKNLEKLSSGYKINRAGDDAAGLAISEKMRAQISGLNAASKNVKDGISLVKTAEGAMQEVQDMLNRMVTLATQSANGTYDNEVDRLNLQKEVDQLRSEINRIADSANFNGIKLLDGSQEIKSSYNIASPSGNPGDVSAMGFKIISDGQLGVDPQAGIFSYDLSQLKITVTDADVAGEAGQADGPGRAADTSASWTQGSATPLSGSKAKFEFKASSAAATVGASRVKSTTAIATGAKVEITIDGKKYVFTAASAAGSATASTATVAKGTSAADFLKNVKSALDTMLETRSNAAKASAVAASGTSYDKHEVTALTVGSQGVTMTARSVKMNKAENTDATTTTASITAAIASSVKNALAKPGSAVGTIAGTVSFTVDGATISLKVANASGTDVDVVIGKDATGSDALKAINNAIKTKVDAINASRAAAATSGTYKEIGEVKLDTDGKAQVTITTKDAGGNKTEAPTKTFTFQLGKNDTIELELGVGTYSGADLAKMLAEKLNAPVAAGSAGVEGQIMTLADGDQDATGDGTRKLGGAAFTASVMGSTLTITMDEAPTEKWDEDMTLKFSDGSGNGGEQFKPTVVQEAIDSTVSRQYAQATIDLNEISSMLKDGFTIQLGNTTYTFAIGSDSRFKNAGNVVDLTDLTMEDFKQAGARGFHTAANRLSKAAAANSTFLVGSDTKGGVSLTEKEGAIDYSVNNLAGSDNKGTAGEGTGIIDDPNTAANNANGVNSTFADWKGLVKMGQASVSGNGLTLQIGDTSESYNQLVVNIGDIHTKALGIDNIDISTQAGAQTAVNVVKDAINTVSSIRGTLGATQNRLEHTANNLSVMTENIQDAESTIRDTDIAEEMMAYTKNNILVQSAQAMLAQANQIPQGVLQLLG